MSYYKMTSFENLTSKELMILAKKILAKPRNVDGYGTMSIDNN